VLCAWCSRERKREDNIEMKAYFLFLKHILNFFNIFNAYFQSTETRIHLLQFKSVNFLSQVCQNFVKKEYLQNIATNMDFSQKQNQKDINEIKNVIKIDHTGNFYWW